MTFLGFFKVFHAFYIPLPYFLLFFYFLPFSCRFFENERFFTVYGILYTVYCIPLKSTCLFFVEILKMNGKQRQGGVYIFYLSHFARVFQKNVLENTKRSTRISKIKKSFFCNFGFYCFFFNNLTLTFQLSTVFYICWFVLATITVVGNYAIFSMYTTVQKTSSLYNIIYFVLE